MNNSVLNATLFVGSSTFRNYEFEKLLGCCVDIYTEIISKNHLCENKEEKIRDCFFDYLNNDNYRNKVQTLENYHFEKEPQENIGYLDIKVKTINPYRSTKAYYIIECKRLDSNNPKGTTGLNAEYIKNGICRFVSEFYSSYYNCNVMFGFVVSSMNISANVSNINAILDKDYINDKGSPAKAHVIQYLSEFTLVEDFHFAYISKHKTKSGKEIILYHLMFDFSKNIR